MIPPPTRPIYPPPSTAVERPQIIDMGPGPNGFMPISQILLPNRLMIGIDGPADTGKTEFSMSFPEPICMLLVDQGYEHVLRNPHPPATRKKQIDCKIFKLPQAGMNPKQDSGQASSADAQAAYQSIWADFYANYMSAVSSPKYRTVIIDGDTDTWNLQRLAAFGKLTQVPPLEYTKVNQARRIMIRRGFDSGKNIVFTYQVSDEYETTVKLNSRGEPKEVSEKTGNLKRKGFSDQDYLVQVQLRTMTGKKVDGSIQFGVEISKCKADLELVGVQLWGDDCNYKGVVQAIYGDVEEGDWGL